MDEMTSAFPIINNRYQILSTIANGGMSVVYRAKDLTLEREIALKVLRENLSLNPAFQDRFRTEAKSSAQLSHPNIVATYDFGVDNDRFFIVMELINGSDLKAWINDKKITSNTIALNLMIQASKGLAYAHGQGIIHCDIKPHNMLVSNDGVLKIADFGISRALDTISRSERNSEIWASPYYVSPEQTHGFPPSPASDVYAMGVILYEVFTGKLPFDGKDALELIEKHQTQSPTPPNVINASIPKNLEFIILKSLEKNPSLRFENGLALLSKLKNISKDDFRAAKIKAEDSGTSLERERSLKVSTNSHATSLDWTTIILGFFATLMVGGLLPFWLYIYYSINR